MSAKGSRPSSRGTKAPSGSRAAVKTPPKGSKRPPVKPDSAAREVVRGREVEFFKVDDESNPAKGIENANLLVQGIPPIPASLAAQVDKYTDFRGHGFVTWHPTKAEMIVSHRAPGSSVNHLFRLAAPMGKQPKTLRADVAHRA
mgnify:CR=1 FL=1